MRACRELIEQLKGDLVGMTVLIELCDLNGRQCLGTDLEVHPVLQY